MNYGNDLVQMTNLPEPIFWLWLSGIVFFIMAVVLLTGPFRHDRSELMNAFLGFLGGMSIFHLLGGASMYWDLPLLMYLGSFGAVTGSAFVFKFPLSAILNDGTRKALFYVALLVGWAMIAFMLLNSYEPMMVMDIASIYMIIVSGTLSGFYMIFQGFRINDSSSKIKCIGGGCSIVFCCLLTHLIVITIGMTALAKLFMVLTPITLVLAVLVARRFAKNTV